MVNDKSVHYCRVCGLFQGKNYFPWGEDGHSPTFDICLCCGAEFGFDDCFPEAVKEFREEWLKSGAHWRFAKFKPKNWSLQEQLKNIPHEFK